MCLLIGILRWSALRKSLSACLLTSSALLLGCGGLADTVSPDRFYLERSDLDWSGGRVRDGIGDAMTFGLSWDIPKVQEEPAPPTFPAVAREVRDLVPLPAPDPEPDPEPALPDEQAISLWWSLVIVPLVGALVEYLRRRRKNPIRDDMK